MSATISKHFLGKQTDWQNCAYIKYATNKYRHRLEYAGEKITYKFEIYRIISHTGLPSWTNYAKFVKLQFSSRCQQIHFSKLFSHNYL